MKKQRSTVILVILLIISSLIFLYPNFSDYWNSQRQTKVIADYNENMSNMDEDDYAKLLDLATKYNQEIAKKERQTFENGQPIDEEYISLLNINDSKIMGYISIDKIDVNLPIYHGTSDSVLAIATGHLEGSSLPIGGQSTHTVITGHRGLATATLFTDLNKMAIGDVFTLNILSQTLTYQVDQLLIVSPEEVEHLAVVDNQDYCTLVTCTPFGINTERILVRGTRIDNIDADKNVEVKSEATVINPMAVFPFMAIPIIIVIIIVLFCLPASKNEDEDED